MNYIELLGFARFIVGCLIVKDRAWVERIAAERKGTPQADLLLEELNYMALEDEVGFAQAMEETMDELESAA